jgi:hypothetical protein
MLMEEVCMLTIGMIGALFLKALMHDASAGAVTSRPGRVD